MSIWMIGAIGLVLAFIAVRYLRGGADVTSWTQHATHSGNLELLIEHIETSGPDTATLWNQAIDSLWQAYQRDMAARLVVEGARRSDAPIIQYWLRRFQEVEPELAREHFSEGFLAEHYRPDVAAKCGKSCGCG